MTAQPSIPLIITLLPVEDIDKLGDEWRELESRSDTHSFFLSWYWIGCWLRCISPNIKPMVLRIAGKGGLTGLAILCKGKGPVLRFARLNQVLLNVAGDPELDDIAIEYNGFLSASGMADTVTQAGFEWLMQGDFANQALRLDGIDEHLSNLAITTALPLGRQPHLLSFHPAPFVDLAAIRDSGKDYLSHLSRNTRQSMKRTIRHYENIGPLEYHVARSLNEALVLYAELEVAHQANWRARGKPGAFALPAFKRFHLALINSAFADGHIEMARISADGQPIGYLYNFIWRGTVLAYQSGFNYSEDEAAKPGYVSHYMAVLSATAKGYNIYDFMAGQMQHKSSLSNGTQNLSWLLLRAQTPLVRLENLARKLRDAIYKR
jgi:CelD/BcsL family acetyltransferase involved in cellulose biosynthesis